MQSLIESVSEILFEGVLDTHLTKIGFDKAKSKELAKKWSNIPSQYKKGINVLGIRSVEDVLDAFERMEAKWSDSKTGKEQAVKRQGIKGLVQGKDYVELETGYPEIEAYAPLHHQASRLIASTRIGPCEGEWCTAANDPEKWEEYTTEGKKLIYIITPSTKFAIAALEFAGGMDVEIFTAANKIIRDLPRPLDTKKLLSQLGKIEIRLSPRAKIILTVRENPRADLNGYDISSITDMSNLFNGTPFKGDISKWDVSHVKNMDNMFELCSFNGDISRWDVSNVQSMKSMFFNSDFNGNISQWDVSSVKDMRGMFYLSKFNGDISDWDVPNSASTSNMFKGCPLEKNPPHWFKGK